MRLFLWAQYRGWLAGGVLFTGMMGAMSQQFLDAMAGNSALAEAIGIGKGRPIDGLVAASQLHLAVIAAGYLVQAIGALRTEESEGRLESRLPGHFPVAVGWRRTP